MSQVQEAGSVPSAQAPPQTPLTTVEVQLTGSDGNAYAILAKVRRELERAGYRDLAARFQEEATAGNYDHLLATCLRYVHVR